MSTFEGAFPEIVQTIKDEYRTMKDQQQSDSKVDEDESAVLTSNILRKFESIYASPPLHEIETVLNEHFEAEQIRRALFSPKDDCDISVFVNGLGNFCVLEAPEDIKLRSLLLSLIYLVHRKNKWFLSHFVLNGGLNKLVLMMADRNMFIRGQAFEVFMSVVDCDVYDWFAPIATQQDVDLHTQLLGLADFQLNTDNHKHPSLFLENIVCNSRQGESYPGGPSRAIQLLAFWLSWVRVTCTHTHTLLLSEDLLSVIHKWGQGVYYRAGAGSGSGTSDDAQSSPQTIENELSLAKTLYEDFSEKQFKKSSEEDEDEDEGDDSSRVVPSAPAHPRTHSTKGYYVAGITKVPQLEVTSSSSSSSSSSPSTTSPSSKTASTATASSSSSAPRAHTPPRQQSSSTPTTACPSPTHTHIIPLVRRLETLKRQGNEHFAHAHFESAIAVYQSMLKHIDDFHSHLQSVQTPVNTDEVDTLHATAHYNIAACYWRMLQALKSKSSGVSGARSPQSQTTILQACEAASRAAVGVQPHHAKAIYRWCACLLELGQPQQALEQVDACLKHFQAQQQKAQQSAQALNAADVTSLQQLRHECIAAIILLQQQQQQQPGKGAATTTTPLAPQLPEQQGASVEKQPSEKEKSKAATKKVTKKESDVIEKDKEKEKDKDTKPKKSKTSKSKLTISDSLAKMLELDEPSSSTATSTTSTTKPPPVMPFPAAGASTSATEDTGASNSLLNSKTAKMLSALQKRTQREQNRVTHAWVDWTPPEDDK